MSDANTSAPVVTVVIPAYNAAAFVCKAIDSVLQQTYPHVEIVVVDDESKDNTSEVVQPYVDRGQAKLVRHVKNKGLPGARNTAIRNGTGQYVAFLDADDLWLPNHLSEALAVLEQHADIDVVVFNFDIVDMKTGAKLGNWFHERRAAMARLQTKPIENDTQLITGGLLSALLAESFIHMQAVVARRSVCEKVMFDERVRRSEDIDWAIRMAYSANGKFAFNPHVSGIYHRHDNSLTTNTNANHELIARTEWMLFREYLQWPGLAAEHREQLRAAVLKYGLALSYYARLRKDAKEAFGYWRQSLPYGAGKQHVTELVKLVASLPKMLG